VGLVEPPNRRAGTLRTLWLGATSQACAKGDARAYLAPTNAGAPMTLILNLLWFVLGGFAAGLSWLLSAALLACTIVGLPWATAALRIGLFTFFPFGRRVVDRRALGREDIGTGPVGCLLNVIWFVLGGWWLALAHIVLGIVFLIPLITIPFAFQHFKLAAIALAPIGKEIVTI
jgi:uncharacterized membrane protein YccF (DUF307 family)